MSDIESETTATRLSSKRILDICDLALTIANPVLPVQRFPFIKKNMNSQAFDIFPLERFQGSDATIRRPRVSRSFFFAYFPRCRRNANVSIGDRLLFL